jgi:hypothetical protein
MANGRREPPHAGRSPFAEVEEMIYLGDNAGRIHVAAGGLGLLAVLLLVCSASPVSAETLIFRNECSAPIVVQAASVSHGRFLRGRPFLLRPGDESPGIALPGEKVVTIYDGKVPNRVLFQKAMPASSLDLRFSILPDVPSPRVRLQARPPAKP